MGRVLFMKKGTVHTVPAAPVFLTDESGNPVMAANTVTDTDMK